MTGPQFPDATESMNHAMSLDGDPETLAKFYDDWATDYDQDIKADYLSPAMMVRTLREAIASNDAFAWASEPSVSVVDAGCGTGLTGVALAKAGYTTIDGVDLSVEMIAQATKTGVYRTLESGFDLLQTPQERWRGAYDLVTIAGVFTVGHVPPDALVNVVALARPGGLVIVSTRAAYYDSTDFGQVSDDLQALGKLDLVHKITDGPYTMDSTAHYWAYRVQG
jgi:predicted TPR repeat methyltransferase